MKRKNESYDIYISIVIKKLIYYFNLIFIHLKCNFLEIFV